MFKFLSKEKYLLDRYARETWKVMCGKFALTEMSGISYQVRIDPNEVSIREIANNKLVDIVPTVKFKAMLEMFK